MRLDPQESNPCRMKLLGASACGGIATAGARQGCELGRTGAARGAPGADPGMGALQEVEIAAEVGDAQVDGAGLEHAEQVAGPTLGEISFGDGQAIIAFEQDPQALRHRWTGMA